MKKLLKALIKSAAFQWLIAFPIAAYIRLVHYTSRRQVDADPAYAPYGRGELPAVIAFWHGRLLMMPMLRPPRRRMNVLISSHGDGEIIARAMHRFGFGTIRGSSTRGGREAASQSVKALRGGQNVAVTPDGPKGPALKIQPGLLVIARMAGVPVIPMTYASTRHKRARSWDRFMIALPFGRIYYKIGAPMVDVTPEALEQEMVRMNDVVDARAGVSHP